LLDGTGEITCGNMRCDYHKLRDSDSVPHLTTLELPFSYEEHGEHKAALVKTVLCGKCCKKITWKRRKERERENQSMEEAEALLEMAAEDGDHHSRGRAGHQSPDGAYLHQHRRRSSRSLSPRARVKHRESGHGRYRD
jgi:protein FRA10AC1